MSHDRHVPMRTCILCGDKNPKQDMLRIVRIDNDTITIDEQSSRKGRGSYVCLDAAAFDARKIDDKIKRALKLQEEIPKDFVEALIARIKSS